MDNLIGKTIDSYKILEVLGRGGMGIVFKALDTNLDKIVALKMIDPFLAKDENFLRRFKTEAKALAKLEDRNVVNVHALRETEFGLFMVMEYVPAKTISEWLREKGKFSVRDTIDITRQILHAINCVHKAGVIHRDIKPNNILLLDDGTVKVMDFGLAKVVQDQSMQTVVTQVAAGTLYYMSPEQIKGLKNVDNRSDIYSLGMTIYEMVTGRNPFEKTESEFSIQKKIVEGKIPPPSVYLPAIPKQFLKFIQKSIDKDPNKRFQNITEMEEALSAVEQPKEEEVTRVISRQAPENKVKDSSRGKNKILIFSVSSVLIIAVAVILYLLFNRKENIKTNDLIRRDTSKSLLENKNVLPVSNLTIKSIPQGAIVLIDGQTKGKTNLQVDSLQNKNYLIEIRLNGYETWSSNYTLKQGDNIISKELKKAVVAAASSINLRMDVSGDIYLNGKKIPVSGNTLISETVSPGKQTVRFVNKNNQSKETTIEVGENQQKNITCYFQHSVSIQTIDEEGNSIWASIILDDKTTELFTPRELSLQSGIHKIYVKKNGYKILEDAKTINISPAFTKNTTPFVFHLKKVL
jgi:serine/threonine protein kinase